MSGRSCKETAKKNNTVPEINRGCFMKNAVKNRKIKEKHCNMHKIIL